MDGAIFTYLIYPAGTVFITAFVTWVFARRKNTAEVTGIDIENAKEIITMHKDMTLQFKEELDRSREIIERHQQIIHNYNIKCIQPKICKGF